MNPTIVEAMKLILNLIWFFLGGLWLAIGYFLAGIIACILVVTIPFGIASFRMASYALWPFGRTVIEPDTGVSAASTVGNIIWFVIAGLWLALGHLTTAAAQAITIVGIPLALANLKMIPVSCFPFGRSIVASDQIPVGYRPMLSM